MSYTVGRYRPPHQRVSIVHLKTNRQLQFEDPDDMLKAISGNTDLETQILSGEWVWTTQEVTGGH